MAAQYITVYEAADGGSGNPAKTTWNFFIGGLSYATKNPNIAQTAQLAIMTNNPVTLTVSAGSLSELRIAITPPVPPAKKTVAKKRLKK